MRSYGVTLTARCPRLAVLLPISTELNRVTGGGWAVLDQSLEWLGRIWGGGGMICVPTDGRTLDDAFEQLLRAYDPDYVFVWMPTLGALATTDLAAARALIRDSSLGLQSKADEDDEQLRASDHLLVGAGWAKAALAQAMAATSAFEVSRFAQYAPRHEGPAVSPLLGLSALALAHTRPLDGLTIGGVTGTAKPGDPALLNDPATDLDLSDVPAHTRRLVKLRTGVRGTAPGSEPGTLSRPGKQVNVHPVDPNTELGALVQLGTLGSVRVNSGPSWGDPDVIARMPLARSMVGLLSLSRGLPRRPALVVVGDRVTDACLTMCWSRTFGEGSVVWLPSRVCQISPSDSAELERDTEAHLLVAHAREALDDPPDQIYGGGWLTSTSIPHATLAGVADLLRAAPAWMQRLPKRLADLQLVMPQDLPRDMPSGVLACPDVFALPTTVTFDEDGAGQQSVTSPIPSLLRRGGSMLAGGVTGPWVAEAQVDECPLPPRRAASEASSSTDPDDDGPEIRASKSGACWSAMADVRVPEEVAAEHVLARVRLREPDLSPLVDALLATSGHTRQLSDAGRFYDGVTRMLGGLPGLLRVLRDANAVAVLGLFLAEPTDRSAAGLILQDRRRYARLSDCRRVARTVRSAVDATDRGPTVGEMRALLDILLDASVLSRGYVLKCSRCRHTAFHPLGEVAATFVCRRCAHQQQLVAESWCRTPPHEPAQFYRLDELVLMALRHEVSVPAFAVDALGGSRREARVLWSTELWYEGVRRSEIDFIVLVEGRLVVGEAKVNGVLGDSQRQADKEVAKTVTAARLLSADDVVFASTTAWNQTSRNAIIAGTGEVQAPRRCILENLR